MVLNFIWDQRWCDHSFMKLEVVVAVKSFHSTHRLMEGNSTQKASPNFRYLSQVWYSCNKWNIKKIIHCQLWKYSQTWNCLIYSVLPRYFFFLHCQVHLIFCKSQYCCDSQMSPAFLHPCHDLHNCQGPKLPSLTYRDGVVFGVSFWHWPSLSW